MNFEERLKADIELFNSALEKYISPEHYTGRESAGFELMLEAMSYSLRNGGKRIRPVLVMEFCRLFGGNAEDALTPACAIEMIHTYSLIHDDLPCMDDDDMRRGKPANHIKFGYANALLAGDALLTLAFETILCDSRLDPEKRSALGAELAKAAGATGMVAGQVMDLQNEEKQASLDEIKATDALKTGELIRTAGVMGCIVAGANEEQRAAAVKYLSAVGLAFQIVDDILDVVSSSEVLGKPVGSDAENGKSTYVSLLGIDEAKRLAAELTAQAKAAVAVYEGSEFLTGLADMLCGRIN